MVKKGQWTINLPAQWPPRQHPAPPFGVTEVEIIRSCPLRAFFDASRSQSYEPRLGYAARVGLAFHRTLESLSDDPLPAGIAPADAAAAARDRFRRELARQELERQSRPRELGLPADEARVDRALQAIILEARRLAEAGLTGGAATYRASDPTALLTAGPAGLESTIAIEVPVQSSDGLLAGRIDRVERDGSTVRLLDYKSALRPDLPERYERQLQLYAWMWAETTGEWPTEAAVVYPFTAQTYPVPIEPSRCEAVAAETRELLHTALEPQPAHRRATPGEVCQVCHYRPWCAPFWHHQANETALRQALDNAYYGFEGPITALRLSDHVWSVDVHWRDLTVQIVAPEERFPQLKEAQVGDHLRALEMRLKGQMFNPRAMVTEYSELWIIKN